MKFLKEWGYRWTPSKTAKREFAQKMNDIDEFCKKNNISQSKSSDSYYFTINGQKYRVSNHTVEASNRHAFNDEGEQIRQLYHRNDREDDVIYITASKTRLIDIYNDLKNGYKLDKCGNRVIKEDYNTKDIINDTYIDTSKQEMSYYQDYLDKPEQANKYHKTTSEIIEMSPKEYFEECAKIFDSTFEKQFEQIENDSETLNELKDVILNKKKMFPIPIINYAENTQDGRHRMFVLGELFGWNKKHPVLIVKDTDEGKEERKYTNTIHALNKITNKALQYTYVDLKDFVDNLEYYLSDLKDYSINSDYSIQTFIDHINIQVDNVEYRIDIDHVNIDPDKFDDLEDILDVDDLQ